MQLYNNIKKAVIKGINEAFDIEDMDNIIDTATDKRKIRKQSKICDRLEELVRKKAFRSPSVTIRTLTPDDIDLLKMIYDDIDNMDDDIQRLVRENDLWDAYYRLYCKGWIQRIVSRILIHRCRPDEEMNTFIHEVLSEIRSNEHPLYALYKVDDANDLKNIIKRMPDDSNLNWIDVSELVSLGYVFDRTTFNGDISLWDVIHVTDMTATFRNSKFNGDISLWDVSGVKSMSVMFNGSAFNGDISNWDVSGVEDMAWMFSVSPFNGDISRWDVSSVRDMSGMFRKSVIDCDLSRWDISNVMDMWRMFEESLKDIDISGWQIPVNCRTREMFSLSKISEMHQPKCLEGRDEIQWSEDQKREWTIKLIDKMVGESFDASDLGNDISSETIKTKVGKHSKMYGQIARLANKKIWKMIPRNVFARLDDDDIKTLRDIYEDYDCFDDESKDLIDRTGLRDAYVRDYLEVMMDGICKKIYKRHEFDERDKAFIGNELMGIHSVDHPLYAYFKPKKLDMNRMQLPSVRDHDIKYIIENIPLDANLNWIDVSEVTNLRMMFAFSSFNGDISLWDVSSVKDLSGTFNNSSFNGDISDWDVSNVDMMVMTFDSAKFNGDISRWDVHNVTLFNAMFSKSFFDGDISEWDVSGAIGMNGMFSCSKFNSDISGWQISDECNVLTMFDRCPIRDSYKPACLENRD